LRRCISKRLEGFNWFWFKKKKKIRNPKLIELKVKVEVKVVGGDYVIQVVESEFEGVVDGKPVS
jgi:hypothetical protein